MPKTKGSSKKTAAKKAAKPKTTKSAKKAKAATNVVEPVAPAAQVEKVVAPVEETPPTPSLTDAFVDVLALLTALRSQLTAVTGQVRSLQKRADRELKNAHKASKKRARRSGNRAPSGFVKPTKISSELAAFLGKPKGTEMARTEVTREINGYIRQHSLQDPQNGRRILADAKLRKLLKLKQSDELTYFNLQRYMSPHFAKKNSVVESA